MNGKFHVEIMCEKCGKPGHVYHEDMEDGRIRVHTLCPECLNGGKQEGQDRDIPTILTGENLGYGIPDWEVTYDPKEQTISIWVDSEYGIRLDDDSIEQLYGIITKYRKKKGI